MRRDGQREQERRERVEPTAGIADGPGMGPPCERAEAHRDDARVNTRRHDELPHRHGCEREQCGDHGDDQRNAAEAKMAVEAKRERHHRDERQSLERRLRTERAHCRQGHHVGESRVVVERRHPRRPDIEPVVIGKPVGDEFQPREVVRGVNTLGETIPRPKERSHGYDHGDDPGPRDRLAARSRDHVDRARRSARIRRKSAVSAAIARPARKSRWTRRSSSTICEPAGSVRRSIPSVSGPAVTLFPSTDACQPLSYASRTIRSPADWVSTRQCPRPLTAVTGAVPRVTAPR